MFDLGFPPYWSTIKKLIWLVGSGVVGGTGWTTLTGSIVSFIASKAKAINAIVVDIEPQQSGTGDPSPTNVRPISGYTEAKIFIKDEYDASATPTKTISWQTEAGTVYGGTLNVTTGELTVTKAYFTSNSSDGWAYASGAFYYDNAMNNTIQTTGTAGFVCNKYVETSSINSSSYVADRANNTFFNQYRNNADRTDRLWIKDTSLTSLSDLNTSLSANPIQLAYPLKVSATYHLDSIEALYTLVGQNNIWVDCSDSIAVTIPSNIIVSGDAPKADTGRAGFMVLTS